MKAIILAAGEGSRMKAEMPKVLHTIAGQPILHHVIKACLAANITDLAVVVGNKGQAVIDATPFPVQFVWQHEQLGTGHAVGCARSFIAAGEADEDVLVLNGDTPLITAAFLEALQAARQRESAAGLVVSTTLPNPFGYGRVFTGPDGTFQEIVEQKDLLPGQDTHTQVNTGVCVYAADALLYGLDNIRNDNQQCEYYLTDVPGVLRKAGRRVVVFHSEDGAQFSGINTQKQLAEAAAYLRARINDMHMENGVVMLDPATTYIDAAVDIAPQVVIHPGVMLEGATRIGRGTTLLPYTRITDSEVGQHTSVGPFACLRAGARVGNHCRIGNFVEIKNSQVGDHTNAAHLAYIGDADVGDRVNFGCGAVTVNYDGEKKHRTTVENDVFVGCNANLVAPITVHTGAYVAAGSTIVSEVPEEALAIARERQTNKTGWVSKYRRKG